MEKNTRVTSVLTGAVIVAALGYFVDIYDLILFSMVRKPSLVELGLSGSALTDVGGWLMSVQMFGMLAGGILWGVLGDRRGRLSVLFGSIVMYSLANIANGFVHSVEAYAWLRLIAGIGLAGELGAGITLVSEIMHKERRGYGTTVVASVGLLGAIVAYFVYAEFGWRNAYFIGGGMGLLLLVLRITVYESGMFTQVKQSGVSRGNFLSFFTNLDRFLRYVRCILIGVPLWFVVGILVFYASEFGTVLHIAPAVDSGTAVMLCYVGLTIGDIASGLISQYLRSRKRVVFLFLCAMSVLVAVYLSGLVVTRDLFYVLSVLLGISAGYWAMFVTIASEQFGTNVRATATTTVPNFVRGTVPLLNAVFLPLREQIGMIPTAGILAAMVLAAAFLTLRGLEETFDKDLDYLEGHG